MKRELLDHIIPLNAMHLQRLVSKYVHSYYNPYRTHQGIGRKTPIPPESPPTPIDVSTPLESQPILGGLYHVYRKAA